MTVTTIISSGERVIASRVSTLLLSHRLNKQAQAVSVRTIRNVGQETLDGDDLSELRAEYNRKVNEELPERARRSDGWPIHLDHCFGRVVLDNVFGDRWYSHVDGRPAYRNLPRGELQEAIGIADRMLEEGKPAVEELNQNSLRWRDKLE